jgi:hypothetical protein
METYYTNTKTASWLLGIGQAALYKRIREGRTEWLKFGGMYMLPLKEIAKELRMTQKDLTDRMLSEELPIWRCK